MIKKTNRINLEKYTRKKCYRKLNKLTISKIKSGVFQQIGAR